MNVRAWNAIFAKAGTPKDVLDRLTTEVTRIAGQREVIDNLTHRGLEPSSMSPAAFRERLTTESSHWKTVVEKAGITVE